MYLKFLRFFFRITGTVFPSFTAKYAVSLFYTPRRFPAAKWEIRSLADARDDSVAWKDEPLPLKIRGNGPTVLLVHGWEGRGSQLARIGDALVEQGFKVVSFDGPAHGAARTRRTHLVEFSEAISAVARYVGPLHGAVGHSFGAAALGMAIERDVKVGRLVLISCPSSIRNVVGRFAKFLAVPERAHQKMYPIMDKLHRCADSDLDFRNIGPAIRCPALIIHDENDRYVLHKDGMAVAESIAHSQTSWTSGLGHLRILQDRAVVETSAAFINPGAPVNTSPVREMAQTS